MNGAAFPPPPPRRTPVGRLQGFEGHFLGIQESITRLRVLPATRQPGQARRRGQRHLRRQRHRARRAPGVPQPNPAKLRRSPLPSSQHLGRHTVLLDRQTTPPRSPRLIHEPGRIQQPQAHHKLWVMTSLEGRGIIGTRAGRPCWWRSPVRPGVNPPPRGACGVAKAGINSRVRVYHGTSARDTLRGGAAAAGGDLHAAGATAVGWPQRGLWRPDTKSPSRSPRGRPGDGGVSNSWRGGT